MTNSRGTRIAVVSALVGVLLAGILVAVGVLSNVSPASANEQLYLEAVNDVGADPFAPTAGPKNPVSRPVGAAAPGMNIEAAGCDPAALVSSLQGDARLAAAWTEALNSDSTLTWSGGNTVRPDQVGAYIAELTPQVLGTDLRVTNFHYTSGAPTSVQSVLQQGSSVMVDKAGVVRVRCRCGNPLTPLRRLTARPVYEGAPWVGFVDVDIIVVNEKACDGDERFDDGRCRPRCDDDQRFDDGRCRPRCDDDQQFDDGRCRSRCVDGTRFSGGDCRPVGCDDDGERRDGDRCRPASCPDDKVRVDEECADPPAPAAPVDPVAAPVDPAAAPTDPTDPAAPAPPTDSRPPTASEAPAAAPPSPAAASPSPAAAPPSPAAASPSPPPPPASTAPAPPPATSSVPPA